MRTNPTMGILRKVQVIRPLKSLTKINMMHNSNSKSTNHILSCGFLVNQ